MADRRMMRRRTGGHREALLLGTALCLAWSAPAASQLLPNARPQGGTVSGGAATITRSATDTAINQTTSRAVIDWSGFDVGRNQSVTFVQPGATATVLNRVNAAEPSQIAGRITANGQVIIENRSGIIFANSAQVDARALVATASGIATDRFMAGSTKFDIPAKPGAAVINRGRITVAETGLAALVAPNVTNSGVIEARLGRVILAGAATHTLDLYGDGMLSIDIGTDGKVINTGSIRAEGGRVLLTAAAADGIVSTLVEAGGHISADSAAGRPGSVRIQATGGSIVIEGTLSAAGLRPGTVGGSIAVQASGTATLRNTARLNAEGRAGGGIIAIGSASSAASEILAGALMSADATGVGAGGKVTVLSQRKTAMAGRITARGGPSGGAGGTVEVSGSQGFTLTGAIDVSAPAGPAGTILLDPQDLIIVAGGADSAIFQPGGGGGRVDVANNGTSATPIVAALDPSVFEALTGNVVLQASRDLSVLSPVTAHASSLTMEAGRNLTVAAPVTLVGTGTITLSAAVAGFAAAPGYDPGGPLGVLAVTAAGSVNAPDGSVVLNGGAGGARIDGTVQARTINAGIVDGTLAINGVANAATASLAGGAIAIAGTLAGTDLRLDTSGGTTIDLPGRVAALGTLTLLAGTSITAAGTIAAARLAGTADIASFSGGANAIASIGDFTATTSFGLATTADLLVAGRLRAGTAISLSVGGTLAIGEAGGSGASIDAASVALSATGAISAPTGVVVAGTLALAGARIDLPNGNQIVQLGTITAIGPVLINDLSALDVAAPITLGGAGASLTLLSSATTVRPTATLSVPGDVVLAASTLAVQGAIDAGGISLRGNALTIAAPLNVGGGTIELAPYTQGGTILLGGNVFTASSSLTAGTLRVGAAGGTVRAGAIVVTGFDAAGVGTLELDSTGPISQTGTLRAARLDATGSDLLLGDPANAIASLGNLAASSLVVATGGDLALAGVLAASTVELRVAGALTQAGGVIAADVLRGSAGAAGLDAANTIAELAGFTTNGDFSLTDTRALLVTGTLAGSAVTLTVPQGDLVLGAAGRAALLDAGTVRLSVGGAISEPNGVIQAGLLAGSAAAVDLPGANGVTALGNFASAGDFHLANAGGLAVSGTLSAGGSPAPDPANTATLRLDVAGDLVIAGRLDAGTLSLHATGTIATAGGTVAANLVFGDAARLDLAGANAIAALGDFASPAGCG